MDLYRIWPSFVHLPEKGVGVKRAYLVLCNFCLIYIFNDTNSLFPMRNLHQRCGPPRSSGQWLLVAKSTWSQLVAPSSWWPGMQGRWPVHTAGSGRRPGVRPRGPGALGGPEKVTGDHTQPKRYESKMFYAGSGHFCHPVGTHELCTERIWGRWVSRPAFWLRDW